MGYDDLGRPIDGSLGIEALDVAILGQQHPALWIGEVALRFARGLPVRRSRRLAGLLASSRLALLFGLCPAALLFFGGRLGFGLKLGLGLADLFQPLLVVGHPIGQFLAAFSPSSRSSCRSA